ncbi:MAG: hypothetical protein JJ971_12035 [Balneolaceae bacterium]|nr:hypothetical protein [Balneolaceae bacterium]MBO6547419.1 hypothetical protein [Balneolaceae bacterium]MBO6647634.1 hypothetical protein [Balneolaceae bacterium]
MLKRASLLFTALFFISIPLKAQSESEIKSLKFGLANYLNLSSFDAELPFWLHNQKFGKVDQSSANTLIYGALESELYSKDYFSIRAGGDLVGRISENSVLFLNQMYVKFDLGSVKLSGGRFYNPLALKEDELSTGSFTISRNATPIPKIALYTDGFVAVPGTNEILNISGLVSHGWFTDNRFTNNAYLHQKYLYLGIRYAFFYAKGGVIHNVQWAGSNEVNGNLPNSFPDFLEAAFAIGSSDSEAPRGEQTNALGNSVAAYDFSLELFLKSTYVKINRLFYLEDKVSSRFRSPWDGIWGLSLKPKDTELITSFLYEHINTKRQDSFDFEPYGTASYYNHFIYRTGWTYEGRVIGNSLLLTDGTKDQPIYNNIIVAHHLGVTGKLPFQMGYKLLYTYSRNYGEVQDQIISQTSETGPVIGVLRPLEELKKINHSFLLDFEKRLASVPQITFGAGVAIDMGELYEDRVGISFNIHYQLH